jgi:plastocyanin
MAQTVRTLEELSMHQLLRPAGVLVMTLVLAACGSSTASGPAASTAPTTATAPSAAPASAGAPSAAAGGGGAACAAAPAGTAPTVTVTIKNLAYSPEPVTGKVGDVIGWMNNDTVPHTATLDDNTCTTDTINVGASGALTFSAPGTYAYHCTIHPTIMKGTITITG